MAQNFMEISVVERVRHDWRAPSLEFRGRLAFVFGSVSMPRYQLIGAKPATSIAIEDVLYRDRVPFIGEWRR
jgi:hypothetical protein